MRAGDPFRLVPAAAGQDANWKLAVENYVECYHCSPAHPEYSQTHALEKPPEVIAAMEARTCALGIEVGSGNHWQTSANGAEAIDVFRYALYLAEVARA